jgi:sulfite exporter TauE/SafE
MLSGSGLKGASVMAGFGFGTLPSVTAVAMGLSGFRKFAHTRRARLGVGIGISAVAAASLAIPAVVSNVLCLR